VGGAAVTPLPTPGTTFAGVLILREVRGTGGKWFVAECKCSATWHVNFETLRKHSAAGTVPSCKPCRSRAQAARGVEAGGFGGKHQRGRRAGMAESSGKFCGVCYDMTHARPRPHCPGCSLPYVEEPPVSLDEIMSMPRDPGRTLPEGGC